MIDKEELKKLAQIKSLNLGQAEKDYFQNIVLFNLYKIYSTELVFKGETALSKCYGLDRFSEDLDFTASSLFDSNKLKEKLNRFFQEYDFQEKKVVGNNLKITIRFKGPLYTGQKNSTCKIVLDISYRENILVTPEIRKIISEIEVPSFDVYVMAKEEILSEKIRAIMTRDKARDVYDLWYLLKAKTVVNKKLINEKLKYYSQEWDANKFKEKLLDKKNIWETELSSLIDVVPSFKDVLEDIHEKI